VNSGAPAPSGTQITLNGGTGYAKVTHQTGGWGGTEIIVRPVTSGGAATNMLSVTNLDLLQLLNYAVTRGWIPSSRDYVLGVEFGAEPRRRAADGARPRRTAGR
jgi:hypothetical protein